MNTSMDNWFEIFKVQIVTPTTKISQRKEPKEETDDSCWNKFYSACQWLSQNVEDQYITHKLPTRKHSTLAAIPDKFFCDLMEAATKENVINEQSGAQGKTETLEYSGSIDCYLDDHVNVDIIIVTRNLRNDQEQLDEWLTEYHEGGDYAGMGAYRNAYQKYNHFNRVFHFQITMDWKTTDNKRMGPGNMDNEKNQKIYDVIKTFLGMIGQEPYSSGPIYRDNVDR